LRRATRTALKKNQPSNFSVQLAATRILIFLYAKLSSQHFGGILMALALRYRIVWVSLLILGVMITPLIKEKSLTAGASSLTVQHRYSQPDNPVLWQSRAEAGIFVLRQQKETVVCNDATALERQALTADDTRIPLHILTDAESFARQAHKEKGLMIIYRGTAQLENYPQAKAALRRAAAIWMARIKNDITVRIDVDFGVRRFGATYPTDILGVSRAQEVCAENLYPQLRETLLGGAATSQEAAIYASLPQDFLLTDRGATQNIAAPTSLFRSLGLLESDADPAAERATLGEPPAISFNSAFPFDFDPRDGIDSDKIDFEGLALHQIGHLLGFVSETTEGLATTPVFVTPWDLLRSRSSVTTNRFTAAQLISNAGVEPQDFTGDHPILLSVKPSNHPGSDALQSASHWRNESSGNHDFGLMEAIARFGQRLTITQNDLRALAYLGHSVELTPAAAEEVIALASGVAVMGSTAAPSQDVCLLHPVQYTIQVPNNATQVKIDLAGRPNLDLFVRINGPVLIYGPAAYAHYVSASEGGDESILITADSSSIILPGTYYIAIGNCGDGAGSFTLTATVDSPGSAPVINTFAARLEGDVLNLTGSATDADADVVKASVKLFNEAGSEVISLPNVPVSLGTAQSSSAFSIPLSGMSQANALAVVRANLILTDAKGNNSATAAASFNQADAGGAMIKNASFDAPGEAMILKSSYFTNDMQVEINGRIVTPPLSAKLKGAKIKLSGTAAQLGLRTGANRLRLLANGLYSNLFVLLN
jgi:hypothetical protein